MSDEQQRDNTPVIVGAVAIGLIAVVLVLAKLSGTSGPSGDVSPVTGFGPGPSGPSAIVGAPKVAKEPVKMAVPETPAQATIVLDIHDPRAARGVLSGNDWLKDTAKQPLGRGFLGAWAGFLGTKGEDLKATFSGAVADLLSSEMLSAPFRVVWFGGKGATGAPAIIVPFAGDGARTAYAALDTAARRGTYTAPGCPGTLPDKVPEGAAPSPASGLTIARWVVADHAVYAAMQDRMIVLGQAPQPVLQGLCVKLGKLERPPGVDLEVELASQGLGREAQGMVRLLGLGPTPRLEFAIEGTRLVPKGIAAEIASAGRLDAGPISDDLLKLVPEDVPVLLALHLKLPAQLDRAALDAHLAGKGGGPTETRTAILVWNPRGDPEAPSEVALVWSKASDKAALEKIFAGPNGGKVSSVCRQTVLASGDAILRRLEASCSGKTPSILSAQSEVIQGLRAPSSISLGIHTGRLLSQLTLDGYQLEVRGAGQKPSLPAAPPAEIEAARKQLSALPFVGLRGTSQGSSLVPGGFRS